MRPYFFIFFSVFLINFSCQKETSKKNIPVQKTGMNTVVEHANYTKIDAAASKEIKQWKEYFTVEDFMQQLRKTSPTEALNNALELKTLTKQLKDSLTIKALKTPAFKARENVFENEILRLADMTYIPSITSKEVNNQVDKIFSLFSSMNHKINAVYAKKSFDKANKIDSLFSGFK
ncbi:hypothetical protein [Tenacibaculum soleae]|uniref:hypothetical protein n=1 Tax=Tenacibaculum soleae TaxID=447689 RepID=UPI0026E26474|nr:hypothetical protein [Tenacibaculum soleae]MDO6812770.1 hypothetical protein [Tenacibaculum soleae]